VSTPLLAIKCHISPPYPSMLPCPPLDEPRNAHLPRRKDGLAHAHVSGSVLLGQTTRVNPARFSAA
jgi:hypothetical protein